jgi:hypothetical protein
VLTQELIHEKRKISSTPVSPGTNPEWFVVDALGNFYGVTGYGDAFGGAMVYEITPRINPRIGRRLSGCVRSCKTLLDNYTNWQRS